MDVLEQRLADTLLRRPTPSRSSMRGGVFRYWGWSYPHTYGLEGDAVAALECVAAYHHVAVDVVLLGMVVCGMAHADNSRTVDLTLYAPMRDGLAETSMVGLFSDWRDIVFGVDPEFGTVLGTI